MDDKEDPMLVEEVDKDDEDWMDSPALVAPVLPPTPAPPAIPAAPTAPAAPTSPVSPTARAPTVVPDIVSPNDPKEEDPGWTTTFHYKYHSETTYYHNLHREMLDTYYADLETSIRYRCAKYTHPYEATCWWSDISITICNETHDS